VYFVQFILWCLYDAYRDKKIVIFIAFSCTTSTYEGVIDTITIWHKKNWFYRSRLAKIAETYATSNKKVNYATCAIDSLIDYKIDVLRFAWKTSKTIVLKKVRNGKTVNVVVKMKTLLPQIERCRTTLKH
jgi:hypothetical protein